MATDISNISIGFIMGKTVLPIFLGCFSSDLFFILAGNKDIDESSEEFEVWLNSTTECGVRCP